jgi:hypothetical protein
MANKHFFQPVRMESQYVDTKLQTVMFQADEANAACYDGELAVLGDFVKDPVYLGAFTAASAADSAPVDFNTRAATVPAAATAVGVGVIDLPTVPTAAGAGVTYRMGYKTIGLTAEAGVPVRFRKLVVDDTFATGEENCTAALTVGQYAVLATGGDAGKWAPAADAAATGCYAKVISKYIVSQGVDGKVTDDGVQAYMLCVMAN